MSNQIKLAIGSSFTVATLILITMGAASAQDKGCMKTARSVQQTQPQPNISPAQFSRSGYIRGK